MLWGVVSLLCAPDTPLSRGCWEKPSPAWSGLVPCPHAETVFQPLPPTFSPLRVTEAATLRKATVSLQQRGGHSVYDAGPRHRKGCPVLDREPPTGKLDVS